MSFYLLVGTVMWTLNHVLPDPAELEARKWEAMGVARPYIAVPVSDVDFAIFRESR
jgi:hypothetical protein